MIPREFGNTGIKLSPLTFGSMRLDPARIELKTAIALISYLYANGVNTFHSSHEYDTDPFFCQVIQQFRQLHPGAEILHIAKIPAPHFGEKFNSGKLIALIEQRLQQLGTERIDLVQWLVRHQPNDDRHRLPILTDCQQELYETWSKLQNQGKVGSLTSFPYSVPFAQEVLRFSCCRGLVTYLNLLELEMIPILEQMELEGQGYIAIRPLCGGLITSENAQNAENKIDESSQLQAIINTLNIPITDVTKFAVQFPLLHPTVASVMVSVSNLKHAEEVIAAADTAKSDRTAFSQIVQSMNCRFLF